MAEPRMKTTVTLRANARGLNHSRTLVEIRDLALDIDEPKARGGTNAGPSPTDTALAALAGCTNVIGNKCAERLGLPIGTIAVEIACDFDRRGVTLDKEIEVPFVALRQRVTCDGPVSEPDLQALGAEVAKYCPLSKLFEQAGTRLETSWHKA